MGQFSSDRWRLCVLTAAAGLIVVASAMQVIGRHKAHDAWGLAEDIAQSGRDALTHSTRLRLYLAENSKPDPARIVELVRGCAGAVRETLHLLRSFDRSVGARSLRDEFEETEKLAAELAAASQDAAKDEAGKIIVRISVSLSSFERDMLRASGAAQAVLNMRGRTARRWQRAAFWFTLAGLAALLPALVVQLGQVMEGSVGRPRIERELARVAAGGVFQGRMELLRPPAHRDGGRWELNLVRIRSDRKSHVVFEAEARSGDARVLLWGKRYRWVGFVKSFQRLFLPAYDSATWNILCAMHNAGMASPVPIVWERVRRRGVPVGGIILAEHIGQVEQLQGFIRAGFALLPAERRAALLDKLAGLVNRLHALDVYDFTPRYFWGSGWSGGEITLYLFDLDKAHLLRSVPAFIKRHYRSRGIRRLKRLIEQFATPDELAAFEQRLEQAPPGATSPSDVL